MTTSRISRLLLPLLLAGTVTLPACARLSQVGRTPEMSAPQRGTEFHAMTEPVLMLPEENVPAPVADASLWAGSRNSLVRDRRAMTRGDILTVVIEIDDRAEMQNSSGRKRSAADSVAIEALAGLPQRLDPELPVGASLGELAEVDASSTFKGSGNVSRREKLKLRVNYELRELTVSGFVRPDDITRSNEVAYDRIAGARISYGGRGQISDVQQPRYGQQIADIVLPW